MEEVWDLGRYPVESSNRPKSERQLAERLRRALKDGNGGMSGDATARVAVLLSL